MEPLAIDGGRPVRKDLLPYGRPQLELEEIEKAIEVLRSEWLTTGPFVGRFEEKFCRWNGTELAVAVSSGSAALHAAVFAAGFGPGDEVIVSPFTFAASVNCIRHVGAQPVLADIDPETLCLDPADVESRLTPKTRGLIAVHYAGQPCEMDPLLDIARELEIIVIEDAAHAMGAEYRGTPVGRLGHMACYSFHPVKHMTTGEGGMVVTNDSEFADKARIFRNHGFVYDDAKRAEMGEWYYEMASLGHNYRLTDFQCAIGIEQLDRVDAMIARRREIAERYTTAIADMISVDVPAVQPHVAHSWHLYPVLLRLDHLRVGRLDVFRALRAENIGVNVHYMPIHLHPYYQDNFGYQRGDFPHAERAYDRLLTIPLFPHMTDEDVDGVIRAMRKVLDHYTVRY